VNTKVIEFDGVNLVVPIIDGYPLHMPYPSLDEFSSYCGPGSGLGDWLVPETLSGLRVSAACYIHDVMWDYAEPTWGEFHYSNSVFVRNLIEIVLVKTPDEDDVQAKRLSEALVYYMAVDKGFKVFWKLKREQEFI
jgi:hypothetical protein